MVNKEAIRKEIIEKSKELEKQLLDDFGFCTEVENTTTVEIKNIENDIDPFDTSSFDIEAIKAGKVPPTKTKSDNLLHDFEIKEIDPFDTSHIETAISTDLTLQDKNVSEKSLFFTFPLRKQ